jgi:hypothetical protein
MAQIARPEADILSAGFTNAADETQDLYASIDEPVIDDSDYISSPTAPADAVSVFRLSDLADPLSPTDHLLRYRYSSSDVGGAQVDLTVQVRQGYTSEAAQGVLVAERTHADISDEVTYEQGTLTADEADLITNYADLFLRLVFNQP